MANTRVTLGEGFADELEREAAATRRMFERLPESAFDWKPHERSMAFVVLAVHITEMIEWVKLALTTNELDYAAKPYQPYKPTTNAELLEYFDRNVKGAIEALQNTSDEEILKTWTVRAGERVYFEKPRVQVLRSDCFNHIIHHRGQLSVYLRLNGIPVPGVYGPTADE